MSDRDRDLIQRLRYYGPHCCDEDISQLCDECERLQAEVATLSVKLAAWENASQHGHPDPCTLGPLCPYCEIKRLQDLLYDAYVLLHDGVQLTDSRWIEIIDRLAKEVWRW